MPEQVSANHQEQSPLSPERNSTPNADEQDMLSSSENIVSNTYIDLEAAERKQLRWFKNIIFGVGVIFSCAFLSVGLYKSWYFVNAQFKLAEDAINIQKEQIKLDEKKLTLIEKKIIKPNEVKKLQLQQDIQEKPLNNRVLSTGIILTLITIIFAVALTIMLNLIKHSFNPPNRDENSPSNSSSVVTPASDLIAGLLTWIKEKFPTK
ncbi:hypothetical protein [Acinetobacter sp. YH12201]|uniref:hypothetical protein n=1 Tax=Acinetobacter sp. YH12201 TaxID=2601140 RepID=UPI0015D3DB82|nr:hypothetical protein [Acinetobacter sp. YH12201]